MRALSTTMRTRSIKHSWMSIVKEEKSKISFLKEGRLLILTESGSDKKLFLLDFENGEYIELPMPPIESFCGCSLKGTIYIFGDCSYYNTENMIYCLHLSTQMYWKKVGNANDMVKTRHKCYPLGNDRILLVDYYVVSPIYHEMFPHYYVRVYDTKKKKLSDLDMFKEKFYLTAVVILQDKMYFLQEDVSEDQTTVYLTFKIYNIGLKSWETSNAELKIHPDLDKFYNFDLTIYRERWILVVYSALNLCFIFDTRANQWLESNIYFDFSDVWELEVVKDYLFVVQRTMSTKYVDLAHLLPKWLIIGDLIMLRELVDNQRAYLADKDDKMDTLGDKKSMIDGLAQRFLIDLDIYLFRTVLSFLVPK